MFDWDRFKNGEIAVHCDTEEKADDFLKECEKRNIKWIGGDNATHHNHYSVNFGLTCYCGKKGVLTYSDKVYFIQKGTTIVKWEVKEVKERTFKEVIANIKEGEVWENGYFKVELKGGSYCIGRTQDQVSKNIIGFVIYPHVKFKLQRKEYTFQEAFKAYEEGKEIESCYTATKFCENEYLENNICSDWKLGVSFKVDEIKGKWYINEVD